MTRQLILFSDLDGTLLDHQTYSYQAAQPALEALRRHKIPLIFASSKTAAEIEVLRDELDLRFPAIVENGAGLDVPDSICSSDGSPLNGHSISPTYPRLLEVLDAVPDTLRDHFVGFSKMSRDEIARLTGLSQDAANRAKARQWSEPGVWQGPRDTYQAWLQELAVHGVQVAEGGRFHTASFGGGKHTQMKKVIDFFQSDHNRSKSPTQFLTIALGDAPNDLEMLISADIAVVIKGSKSERLSNLEEQARGAVLRPAKPGPAGWNDTVLKLLERVSSN